MSKHPLGQFPDLYVDGLEIGEYRAREIKRMRLMGRVWLGVILSCVAFWTAIAFYVWGLFV